jgi:hypothetical protein
MLGAAPCPGMKGVEVVNLALEEVLVRTVGVFGGFCCNRLHPMKALFILLLV